MAEHMETPVVDLIGMRADDFIASKVEAATATTRTGTRTYGR